MSIIDEFVTKYMAENGEDKENIKSAKVVKKICSDFVAFFPYVIEEAAKQVAKENKKSNGKKDKASEKVVALSISGVGKFSIVVKAPRKLNLPVKSGNTDKNQQAQFTPEHLAIQFKIVKTLKDRLKEINLK